MNKSGYRLDSCSDETGVPAMHKITAIAAAIMLSGCTSSDQTAKDNRGMRLHIEHECMAHGSMRVEADGTNEEEQKDKNVEVKVPVPVP